MEFNFAEILNYNFWGNSLREYLIALGVFVLVIIALKVFKKVVIGKIKKLVNHTKTELDDLLIKVIDSVGWPFYLFFSLYLAFQFIELLEIIERIVFYAFLILVIYYIIKAIQVLIDYGVQKLIKKKQEEEKEKFDPSIIKLISKIIKILLWGLALIIILQNLGYNITTLVAGLGIGGIAIAFAMQNILGDIFSSFTIYFDKPFQVGDFIIVGEDMGVVKKIGVKSTRIQTLQGEELVMSNKELTEARVHNYKKMEKRRIVFSFGILYETPTEKIKKIPAIVKKIIDEIDIAETDRVHFKDFGDFSLNFEVVYFLNSSDYNKYMDTQEKINLNIKQEFEKEGIEFAYPTQKIFVNKTG